MEKQSHIVIAQIVYGQVERKYGVRLTRGSFLLGSVLPDLIPSFLYRPHFLRYSRNHVQRLIRFLLPRSESVWNGCMVSLLMGIVCHFYMDFFCYVHTERFHGGLRLHIQYEKQLHQFLLEHLPEMETLSLREAVRSGLDAEELWTCFETRQESYHKIAPSLSNDLHCAILSCTEVIACLAENAEEGCTPEEDRAPFQPAL